MTIDREAGYRPVPTDDGEQLATLDRGPGKQLRIRLKTFNNHPFIDVREWNRRDEDSPWWPTKGKGVSIRPRELADVIAAPRGGPQGGEMLTAGDICWTSAPIPPWAPPDRGHFGTPYLDYRDLCIEQLADDLQLMEERVINTEGALSIQREISRLSIAMLAKVSYQRDQAFARLGFGQGEDDGRDDQEPEDVL